MKYILAILSILVLIAGCSTQTPEDVTGAATTDVDEQEEASEDTQETTDEVAETTDETTEDTTEETDSNSLTGYSVKIVDRKFEPKFLTVPAGSTVTWTHSDELAQKHIVLVKGEEKSGYLFKGDTYQFTFKEPGKYLIQDPIYLETTVGQITVE